MEVRQPSLRSLPVFRSDWREKWRAYLWPAARGCSPERLYSYDLTVHGGFADSCSETEPQTRVLSDLRQEHKPQLPPFERYDWLHPRARQGESAIPCPSLRRSWKE